MSIICDVILLTILESTIVNKNAGSFSQFSRWWSQQHAGSEIHIGNHGQSCLTAGNAAVSDIIS